MNPYTLSLDGGLLEASAGTGKTHTLTTLYVRLLFERRLPVDSILVVTFTIAATAELRLKIRQRLRLIERVVRGESVAPEAAALVQPLLEAVSDRAFLAQHLEASLQRFESAPILTIHGFCSRLLAELAFESGGDLWFELSDLTGELLREHLEETLRSELQRLSAEDVEMLRPRLGGLATEQKILQTLLAQPHAEVRPTRTRAPDLSGTRSAWSEAVVELRAHHDSAQDFGTRAKQANSRLQMPTMQRRLAEVAALDPAIVPTREQREALRELIKSVDRVPDHPFGAAVARACAALPLMENALKDMIVHLRRRLFDTAGARLAAWRSEHRVRDYQSLIDDVGAALRGPARATLIAAANRRYQAALIDEFQDTDPTQYEIFDALFAQSRLPLFLVGDPKQAIYGFRGADVFAYLAVAATTKSRVALDTNYRSVPALVDALNRLYAVHPQPFLHPDIRYVQVEAATRSDDVRPTERDGLRFLLVPPRGGTGSTAVSDLVTAVADDLARRLAKPGASPASDIAVLCRTSKQLTELTAALATRGIPTVTYAESDVFETPDAVLFGQLVGALAEPRRPDAIAAALATVALGRTASELAALAEDESAWERWSDRFAAWHERWIRHGFLAAFFALLGAERIPARLLTLSDGERRLTNLLHLAELAHRATIEHRLAPGQLRRWVARQSEINLLDIAERERRQVRLETDEAAVRLATIHRSKGLEYPIVYCPFLGVDSRGPDEVTRFHDPNSGRLVLALDGAERDRAQLEERQEAMRLFYVALTRAKRELHIAIGPTRDLATSTLGFFLFGTHQTLDGDDAFAPLRPAFDKIGVDELEMRLRARLQLLGERAWLERSGAGPALVALPPEPQRPIPAVLSAPPLPRAFGSHSFTSLLRDHEAPLLQTELYADERAGADEPPSSSPPIERDETARRGQTLALFAADDPVGLAEFPRGAGPGRVLHRVLERWIVERPSDAQPLIEEELRTGGIDARRFATSVTGLVRALPQIELPPLTATDRAPRPFAAPPRQLRVELEFTVAMPRTTTIAELAHVLSSHPDGLIAADYGEQVGRLLPTSLRGYLRGFIDLVFCVDRRYYVVDYKSNHLGNEASDYHESRLLQPMREHEYGLQSLLYSLALHRHLRMTLPNYDPDVHWGGVYYLFLRGLSPWRGPQHGVFAYRPTPALLDAMDRLFAKGLA